MTYALAIKGVAPETELSAKILSFSEAIPRIGRVMATHGPCSFNIHLRIGRGRIQRLEVDTEIVPDGASWLQLGIDHITLKERIRWLGGAGASSWLSDEDAEKSYYLTIEAEKYWLKQGNSFDPVIDREVGFADGIQALSDLLHDKQPHRDAGDCNAFGTLIDGNIERIYLNHIDGWLFESHLQVALTRQPKEISDALCKKHCR